ncbi:protocatechuate dioxygenase, partial [Streptomyces sp. NPDC127044]
MTRSHKDTSVTRRRALAVTGGTVAAGGLAVAGYQSAFADGTTTATDAEASAAASAASTTRGAWVVMCSGTGGAVYL